MPEEKSRLGVSSPGKGLLSAVWILIGILVTVESFRLGIGRIEKPGPGMMPFLLGIILVLLSLRLLLSDTLRKGGGGKTGETSIWAGVNFWRMGGVMLSLVGYGILLEKLGFALTTACSLFVLFKFVGSEGWRRALILTCLTVIFAHLLFVTLLRMEMPSFPWEAFF
jgi:hypothetical protein